MLEKEKIAEIKEHLESSQNPLFFFDNDLDGLISFLLFRRFLGRGKGVAIKSFPKLDDTYIRKIRELNPDKLFILDKPLVSNEFLDYCHQHNLPVVWIDHHPPQNPENVFYYNPSSGKNYANEPTSYLCYSAVKRDEWLALIGCLGDWYVPEFAKDFSEKYPDLFDKYSNAGDAIFKSEMGKLSRIILFALKDSTTNVMKMIRLLTEAKSPYEILSKDKKYSTMIKRYEQINSVYQKLLSKALSKADIGGKIIFFNYSGEMSLSRELCNELFYLNQDKIVLVTYVKGEKVNISLTAKNVDLRKVVAKALETVEGTGGGHKNACGASINAKDLDKFKEIVESFA